MARTLLPLNFMLTCISCLCLAGFSDVTLPDDPIRHWRLGEASGTTAVDDADAAAKMASPSGTR